MRTRFTSSTEARARGTAAALALLFVAFVSCDDEPTPVAGQQCRPNQFRACDHECGRGVEQCVEPGLWNGCVCVVLDAGFTGDARAERDASSATDASDASDDRDGDAPAEAGDASEPADGGDSASDGEPE